jgi:hypothetical protein
LAAVILGGILISAFVSGLKILIAEDFLGFMNGEGESSFGGAGEGVAGGWAAWVISDATLVDRDMG